MRLTFGAMRRNHRKLAVCRRGTDKMLHDQADRSGSNRTENLCRFPKLLVLSTAVGVLTACMPPMQMSAPPPMLMMPPQAAVPPAPILQPTAGLRARERFQLAINQLQPGDSARAPLA